MALFGNKEDKEDRKELKAQELMAKYGLDELSDPIDRASVKKISRDLMGNGFIAAGLALQGKSEENAKLTYLSALIEQNWIIIRQLDKLNRR